MRELTAALVLTGMLAATASAVEVPGGRNPRTDCYARFNVEGAAAVSTRVVQCTDGDPSCDQDASCNGSCQFRASLCLNRGDDAPTALRYLHEAVTTRPEDVQALALLARAQWLTGDADAARETLARGLALAPDHSDLRLLNRTIR